MELTKGQMTDLLCATLKCGYADLRMLGQFDYDMNEMVAYLDEVGLDLELNNLVWAGVQLGFREVQEEIEDKLSRMEEELEVGEDVDDELREQIEGILDMNLTLSDDCELYHNFIDTHVTLTTNVEIYQEFFQDELDLFEERTGFSLL